MTKISHYKPKILEGHKTKQEFPTGTREYKIYPELMGGCDIMWHVAVYRSDGIRLRSTRQYNLSQIESWIVLDLENHELRLALGQPQEIARGLIDAAVKKLKARVNGVKSGTVMMLYPTTAGEVDDIEEAEEKQRLDFRAGSYPPTLH